MNLPAFSNATLDLNSWFVRLVFSLSAVWLLAAILAVAFRKGSAAVRHRGWALSIVVAIAMPLLVAVAPEVSLGWIDASVRTRHDSAASRQQPISQLDRPPGWDHRSPAELLLETDEALKADHKPATADQVYRENGQTAFHADRVGQTRPIANSLVLSARRFSALPVDHWTVCLIAVFAPMAWGVVGMVRSTMGLRRLWNGATEIGDSACLQIWRGVAEQLGNRRDVRLRASKSLAVPVCIGWLRPVVLLPADWPAWPRDTLRAILAHEMSHVVRRDVAWQFWARIACVMYWFHPLAWVAAWRMRVERESACDDRVLVAGTNPADYAEILLDFARRMRDSSLLPAAVVAMAQGSQLEERVRAILSSNRNRRPVGRRLSRGMLLAAVALALGAGSLSPLARPTLKLVAAADQITPDAPKSKVSDPSRGESKPAMTRIIIWAVAKKTGRPLRDVEFEISAFGGREASKKATLRTNAEGTADFEWTAGTKITYFWLEDRAPKLVPQNYSWQSGASKGELPARLELRFDLGTEVGGVVQDAAGRPIAGAAVEISLLGYWPGFGFRVTLPKTDLAGRWHWDGAPAVVPSMRISHPDYRPRSAILLRSLKNVTVLSKGLSVTGRILDRQGKPITGARVAAFRGSETTTTTDADGRFTLKNCEPGKASVTVQADGYSPELRELVVAEKTPSLEVRLEPGHTLRLRIVDSKENPIKGAVLFVESWQRSRSLKTQLSSDADGRITWRGAPAGSVEGRVAKRGYMWVKKPFQASDKEQVVALPPELVVSGHVTDAATGKPIQNFQLLCGYRVARKDQVTWASEGPEFKDGTYRFNCDPYPYPAHLLEVIAPGYQLAISRDFAPDEGAQSFDFKLKAGTGVAGAILLPDGSPAARADVGLITERKVRAKPIGLFNGRLDSDALELVRTDAEGHFQFVPPGEEPFRLLVVHDAGFAEATSQQLAKSNHITLSPWGRLRGRVLEGAKPLLNVPVVFQRRAKGPDAESTPGSAFGGKIVNYSRTDADGRFDFDHVLPGPGIVSRATVVSRFQDRSWWTGWATPVDVHAGTTTEVTVGESGVTVTGRVVVDRTPGAAAEYSIDELATVTRWDKKDNRPAQPEAQYFGVILKSGQFRVPDVPAGDYQLTVSIDKTKESDENSSPRERRDFTVGSGQHDFTIPESSGVRNETSFDLGEIHARLFEPKEPH